MKPFKECALPVIVAALLAVSINGAPVNADHGANKQGSLAPAYQELIQIKNVSYSPSTGTIMVQFNQAKPGKVTLGLYDAAGHCFASTVDNGRSAGSVFFDGSNLKSGSYFLKLQNNNELATKAIIIIH